MFIRCLAHEIHSIHDRCSCNFLRSLNSISQDQTWFSGCSYENSFHGFGWNVACGRAASNADTDIGSNSKSREPKPGRGHCQPHACPDSVQRLPSLWGNNCNKGVDTGWYQQVREGASAGHWPRKDPMNKFRCLSLKKMVRWYGRVESCTLLYPEQCLIHSKFSKKNLLDG